MLNKNELSKVLQDMGNHLCPYTDVDNKTEHTSLDNSVKNPSEILWHTFLANYDLCYRAANLISKSDWVYKIVLFKDWLYFRWLRACSVCIMRITNTTSFRGRHWLDNSLSWIASRSEMNTDTPITSYLPTAPGLNM